MTRRAARKRTLTANRSATTDLPELYGENVFGAKAMRRYLSARAYKALQATIHEGRTLDAGVADEVAEGMKTWAISKGATHFTHWFQPLTGTTAEKHDSFIMPDGEGGILLQFSGKELIKGAPDASSFPSGGLRSTFEARGYTAWDPRSPAFIKEGENGATLCIPTVFCGHHGESLDKKTPLLRSEEALSKQLRRLAKLFGLKNANRRPLMELGIEQEYFLVDRALYEKRLDLLQTGRTLFGRAPAKHQQMQDHYLGAIKSRVLAFMEDVDRALWRLAIPAKTRHNEVAPGQYELAPVFEEQNLAVDHNMVLMEVMRDVAERHGLACLLHEKPFAGVNGSGKHTNWSIRGPDGKQWLVPGDNPHENAKFLTVLCAIVQAVDTYADLLRASVATAGNDHRLGAHEAPPAILSIFLGEQLTEILEQIEKGGPRKAKQSGTLNIGVSSLPPLPRDSTDRNRTSPFAYTGNKFEFRAVGASQSCADPSMILNTIVAEALDGICARLEAARSAGREFPAALEEILRGILRDHGRIIYNGDNYTDEWRQEAARRGLPNIEGTPNALNALCSERAKALFAKHGVLSPRELESRCEVYRKEYETIVRIEAECANTIFRTMILPAVIRYENEVASTLNAVHAAGPNVDLRYARELLEKVSRLREDAMAASSSLGAALDSASSDTLPSSMRQLRKVADELEGLVPDDLWPMPSYADLMFLS